MKQHDFEAFLADSTKLINEDILWQRDEDHPLTMQFRVAMISKVRYPIRVIGSYNPATQALTYALIHSQVGRIYALDMGKGHQNPSGSRVGRTHKHRWNEVYHDKEAYEPDDITALANDPVAVWKQFCNEARVTHSGVMYLQFPLQGEGF